MLLRNSKQLVTKPRCLKVGVTVMSSFANNIFKNMQVIDYDVAYYSQQHSIKSFVASCLFIIIHI